MSMEQPARFSIFISVSEWHHIFDWMHSSLKASERDPMGHFLLECRGSRRWWVAADGEQLTVLECDGSPPVGLADPAELVSVLVHSRFFRGHEPHDATLEVEPFEQHRFLTLRGHGFELTLREHPGEFLDWRSLLDSVSGTDVDVETSHLRGACRIASAVPFGAEVPDTVYAWLCGRGGRLMLDAPWIGYAPTAVTIVTDESVPDTVPALISPTRLESLLAAIDEDRVTLTLPATALGPVGLRAGNYRAVLLPVDRWGSERGRLEELLCEFLRIESVKADDEGDYLLETADGISIWVRLHTEARPISVQVFSVLASGVERSSELFEELNSINADAAHVKVIWAAQAVMAEIDIVAESLDMAELANAIEVVRATAARYRALLGVYFATPAEGTATEHD